MAERRGLAQIVQFPRTFGAGFQPAVAGVVSDPDFANVVLLLDFDGVDGATDITDLSNSAHVDTFAGNAEVDTAETFLGENSLLFFGLNDEVTFPDSTDWDFGTGDFTIECGFRIRSTTAIFRGIMGSAITSAGWYFLTDGTANTLRFTNSDVALSIQPFTFLADTWYHVAVSRKGTDLRLFVDGNQIGVTVTDSTDIQGGAGLLFLGAITASTNTITDGALGALRITKGVGRYTANFTPLTEFYPTS